MNKRVTLDDTKFDIGTYNKVLIYGAPDTGKTWLVGTLAAKYNLLYFDLESGVSTLIQLPKEQRAKIQLVPLVDTPDNPYGIEVIYNFFKGARGTVCLEHGKWNCPMCLKKGAEVQQVCINDVPDDTVVVVDSLTQVSNSTMSHVAGYIDLAAIKNQDDKDGFTEYRKQGRVITDILSNVQANRKTKMVFITHEVEATLEDGTKKLVPIAGTSTLSRNTAKYFDTIIYCRVQMNKHKYYSSTTYNDKITTGNRNGFEIEKLPKPSLENVFDLVEKTAVPTAAPAASKFGGIMKAK